MAEYIEREAAIDATRKVSVGLINPTKGAWDLGFTNALHLACNSISAIPAADVRPVVRAKWEDDWETGCSECSACGESYLWEDYDGVGEWNFCPNCGAWMEES